MTAAVELVVLVQAETVGAHARLLAAMRQAWAGGPAARWGVPWN